MTATPKRRLIRATATIGITSVLGLGTTAAFGQVGAANGQPPITINETVEETDKTPQDPAQSSGSTQSTTTESVSSDAEPDSAAAAADAAAVSEIVALFYNPGEVVQRDCVLVTEQSILADLAPEAVNPHDTWLQPSGPDELGEDGGERIVLREYNGGVVTYDIPQETIVAEFAPCTDTETALGVVMASPLADLASIYHEASLANDGSVQVLFRVTKSDQYTPETFEGEFSGLLYSSGYEDFLDTMPESVRSQVENYAVGVEEYVTNSGR